MDLGIRVFTVLLMAAQVAFAESPAKTLGIATSKPAKGPFVKVGDSFMVPYTAKIPGTDITFEMVPVPGGEFLMGSPDSEADRDESEGPQVKVTVAPMWVCKHEVRWEEYDHFRALYQLFTEMEIKGGVEEVSEVDSITAPTPLYEPSHTFEYGHEPMQSAVTMTQYAAQHYTKWLSAISGQQYRLPTEAEWEYACRAGTTTAFYWGDDIDEAEEHAWFYDNSSDDGQHHGAKKTANSFGLYDMHGNVAEWTVNAFTEDGYQWMADKQPINAIDAVKWPAEWATEAVVRGGHWLSDVDELRSAARIVSDDEEWKSHDPNIPLSPWWFTSDPARGVGMRLFRSYKPLDKATITKFWDNIAEDARDDVEARTVAGNTKRGKVGPDLPKVRKSFGL